MSEQVKRYDAVHIRYEDNNIRYGEGCEVEVVTAADYEREVRIAIAAGKRMQDKCDALHSEAEALRAERERLADELAAIRERHAIARRVVDRIGQLCTTPHESKERFIRRVQSVIEWEAQAINGAKPLSAEALQ